MILRVGVFYSTNLLYSIYLLLHRISNAVDVKMIIITWIYKKIKWIHVYVFWVLCCLAIFRSWVSLLYYIYSMKKTVDLLKRLLLGVVKTDSTWHCCILHFSASKMDAQCCYAWLPVCMSGQGWPRSYGDSILTSL